MCTVTIIPQGKHDFILTSNRDEAPNRISLVPDFYQIEGVNLLFPKDEVAGGTWIGVSEKKRMICLLNGAYVCHERQEKYRLSRGVVVKDFMIADAIEATLQTYNLVDIEPFTMVIVDWSTDLKFYELVWDGHNKHITRLPHEPKIWSSSTLYNNDMKANRLEWFNTFKSENELDANSLLTFHKTAGKAHTDYGVVMDRGFVKTTSITQVKKVNNAINMRFESLLDKAVTQTVFKLPQIANE